MVGGGKGRGEGGRGKGEGGGGNILRDLLAGPALVLFLRSIARFKDIEKAGIVQEQFETIKTCLWTK